MQRVLPGRIICPGIAIGKARILIRHINVPHVTVPHGRVIEELERYGRAVSLVREHLHEHVLEAHRDAGLDTRKILDIHELMLGDEHFHESVRSRVSEGLLGPEQALVEEAEHLTGHLESSGDPYLRARVEDIWDMVYNLLSALSLPASQYPAERHRIAEDDILVSQNLFLSEVIKAKNASVRGLVTSSRALTSHAAILLKGFNIPSLGAVEGLESAVRSGDKLVLDAMNSRLIVRPGKKMLTAHLALQKELRSGESRAEQAAAEIRTKDGSRVTLLANIDNSSQVELLLRSELEGIGLFRTEFLLFGTDEIPGEDQQYSVYRQVFATMKGRRVVMRTFDLGADKRLPYLERCLAQNPSLGIRGIRRHLLRRPEELRTQLRALLRAAAGAAVDILIPMVTTRDDVLRVKELFTLVKEELAASSTPFCSAARLGAMIEVPAAAFAVQDILSTVDFASVGTNDLIQYFTAADRDNEAVQHYGDLHNEAVLFMLRYIAEKASDIGRIADLTICGEAASAPENVALLLQMGYRSLSVSPVAAPSIKAAVQATEL